MYLQPGFLTFNNNNKTKGASSNLTLMPTKTSNLYMVNFKHNLSASDYVNFTLGVNASYMLYPE